MSSFGDVDLMSTVYSRSELFRGERRVRLTPLRKGHRASDLEKNCTIITWNKKSFKEVHIEENFNRVQCLDRKIDHEDMSPVMKDQHQLEKQQEESNQNHFQREVRSLYDSLKRLFAIKREAIERHWKKLTLSMFNDEDEPEAWFGVGNEVERSPSCYCVTFCQDTMAQATSKTAAMCNQALATSWHENPICRPK
ncbi:hypothetical protein B0H34DRAFT_810076 [Crassisporium funariophilum]|nr:hypothetical protein B0H34DRAFT_810076 [Crassisporium funariophilum]